MDMAQSTFEIIDRGTDRETLDYNGLHYWLDLTSDPQNSIGWVVMDQHGVRDLCTVAEAASVPGAREYVIERTREAAKRALVRALENGWPKEPIAALNADLAEASGDGLPGE